VHNRTIRSGWRWHRDLLPLESRAGRDGERAHPLAGWSFSLADAIAGGLDEPARSLCALMLERDA
jgi:hypothetical protein